MLTKDELQEIRHLLMIQKSTWEDIRRGRRGPKPNLLTSIGKMIERIDDEVGETPRSTEDS